MNKVEWRKSFKELYLPKSKPTIINIEPLKYITIEYQGNPNDEEFSLVMEAIYGLSYAVKMKSKKLENYYEYTVFPLEGIWDLVDYTKNSSDKDNYQAKIMIRQPDFLDEELFEAYKELTYAKSNNKYVLNAKLEVIEEGLNIQMLHLGSYDSEVISFSKMQEYCDENGYERIDLRHKEIYLSNPNKVSADKLKTVLRFKVNKRP